MKLNFIEKSKDRGLKEKKGKQKRKKDEQACYSCEKQKYFVKDCRSINVMNRRNLNVLQTILVKKEFQKNVEDELKFSKVIINDEYY